MDWNDSEVKDDAESHEQHAGLVGNIDDRWQNERCHSKARKRHIKN